MKKIDIARALRDPEYRSCLSAAELSALPAHPAGLTRVADDTLRTVAGGCGPTTWIESCIPIGSNANCP